MNSFNQPMNDCMKEQMNRQRTNDQTTGRTNGWMGEDRKNELNEIKNE